MQIKPKEYPVFGSSNDLTTAAQQMANALKVPLSELYPLLMVYHNTLLKLGKSQ